MFVVFAFHVPSLWTQGRACQFRCTRKLFFEGPLICVDDALGAHHPQRTQAPQQPTELFDCLIGCSEQRCWSQSERSGCLEIDTEFELGRLLDRQVCGLGALEHLRTGSEQKVVAGTGDGPEVDDASLELAVLVLPVSPGRDRLDGIPMFGDLAVCNPEQVVKGGRFATEAALAADQNEIALAQHLVDCVVLHDDASLAHCFECGTETREAIANLRVVLDVIVAFEIARMATYLSPSTR
jgi:hypothetical protein